LFRNHNDMVSIVKTVPKVPSPSGGNFNQNSEVSFRGVLRVILEHGDLQVTESKYIAEIVIRIVSRLTLDSSSTAPAQPDKPNSHTARAPGFRLRTTCNSLFCFSCVSCLLCLLCLDCLIPCTCPQPLLSRYCLMSYTCVSRLYIVSVFPLSRVRLSSIVPCPFPVVLSVFLVLPVDPACHEPGFSACPFLDLVGFL